jgi:hypothetical protein
MCSSSRKGNPVPIRLVEECAYSARRCKQVVVGRIEDNRLRDDLLMHQRNRHRILRETVQEVGGAIERIDDPLVFRFAGLAALLC